jgi:NAD(P)-dependent dehydrogenase (short-subunit alcohol dehydrogenase family)
MDLQLEGKKAIVTGGSRGIGKAIARQLAREGCDVAICARTAGPLEAAAAEITHETGRKVLPISADTMNPDSIKNFVKQAADGLGSVDILVNCAARVGGTIPDNFDVTTDEQVMQDFEEKALGYLRCAREAAPYMKQNGWGRIINISGGAGRSPGTGISTGMRNIASVALTKSLANNLGPFGINVIAVYPGGTVTEATTERAQARQGVAFDAFREQQRQNTLIKHLVTSEDIAYVVAFLCSPLAISITGEAIAVNGGGSSDMHY